MRILLIEPGRYAREAEIGDSLRDMQKAVGGRIDAIYPYDEPVALVCNDEGKIDGLPLNRALCDENGETYDIIAGTFFICGLGAENFDSLSPQYMEKFKRVFFEPEQHIRMNGCLVSLKIPETSAE